MTPRVMVGSPCGKVPVFDEFYQAFYTIQTPDEHSVNMRARGGSVPRNLNLLVDEAIAQQSTHLFIVEDDSVFAQDTLMRLLAHDKPVVTGLCRARNSPFLAYIYSDIDLENGKLEYRLLKPEDKGLIGPKEGVKATGMGGILLNMDVFKKLTRPYFHHYFIGERECGQDIVFQKSLIDAGIEVYCDLDVIIWHATQVVIGSAYEDGQWRTVFRIGDTSFNAKTS